MTSVADVINGDGIVSELVNTLFDALASQSSQDLYTAVGGTGELPNVQSGHPFVSKRFSDGSYDYRDLDNPFEKMREDGFVDGIKETISDDQYNIENDVNEFEEEL